MAFLPKEKEQYYLQKQLKQQKEQQQISQQNGSIEQRKIKRESVTVSEIPTDASNFGGGFQVYFLFIY